MDPLTAGTKAVLVGARLRRSAERRSLRLRWGRIREEGRPRLTREIEWAFLGALADLRPGGSRLQQLGEPGHVHLRGGRPDPQADRPDGGAHGAHLNADAVTIPLAKQNPTTALFSAIGDVPVVPDGTGGDIPGAPDPNDPNSPANDPNYLEEPGHVRGAEQHPPGAQGRAERAQDNLTPKQVKTENKDYLKWRKCMIGARLGHPDADAQRQGPPLLVRRHGRVRRCNSPRRRGRASFRVPTCRPAPPRRRARARSETAGG